MASVYPGPLLCLGSWAYSSEDQRVGMLPGQGHHRWEGRAPPTGVWGGAAAGVLLAHFPASLSAGVQEQAESLSLRDARTAVFGVTVPKLQLLDDPHRPLARVLR